MSARILHLSLFLAVALIFCFAPRASAQSVYGYSSVEIDTNYVTGDSGTDLDYAAELYYYAETDANLYANDSGAASGSGDSTVILTTTTSVNTTYYLETYHWITTESGSTYCFSCVAPGGWYAGSMSVYADWVEDGPHDYGSIYLGATYDSGDTDTSPPDISGVDYTTYGNEVRGTTGYVIVYGTNLTSMYADTTVSCTWCSSVTYESESQINLYYSIPMDTASGTLTNDIHVAVASVGDAYKNFYVYDPAPSITSISPSTWTAGTATSVTISGSGFGTNPSVSFSDGYVSFSSSSVGDTSISGTVTVGSGDPGGSVTVTVNADAWGGGSFFQAGGGGGGAGSASSSTPQVVGPPEITDISPDSTLINGGNTSITITGIRFGSSCPDVLGFIGGTITVNSCSQTSLNLTISAGSSAEIGPYNQITVRNPTYGSASVDFTVDGPYTMAVDTDGSGLDSGGNPARSTIYYVYLTDGVTAAAGYTIAENFNWTNTSPACSPTPAPGSNACSLGATISGLGTFQDKWSLFSGYTPSGCGINIQDYWQACFSSGTYTDTLGYLSGGSYTASSNIWGYTVTYPSNTGAMPEGYPIPR